MSTRTRVYCDRCGKEVKVRLVSLLIGFLLGTPPILIPPVQQSDVELCRDCGNDFRLWMRGGVRK